MVRQKEACRPTLNDELNARLLGSLLESFFVGVSAVPRE